MQLTISKIIPTPLSGHLKFVYPLESKGAFVIGDSNKVLLLNTNGEAELIAQLDGEDYQWKGKGAELFGEIVRKRVNGFQMLSTEEQDRFKQSEIYKSTRDIPIANYGHDGALLLFSGKNIALLGWEQEGLVELNSTRSKGKEPITRALHPKQNLLMYGTNYGELYSQTFDRGHFLKSVKVDQLPNTCYQLTFSTDGQRLFVAGLGFVRSYDFNGTAFNPGISMTTAVRSFELVEDFLVLNKGMHGLDVVRIKDKPERVTSLDLPFAIDKMYCLGGQKAFLLTSGSSNEWALLAWRE